MEEKQTNANANTNRSALAPCPPDTALRAINGWLALGVLGKSNWKVAGALRPAQCGLQRPDPLRWRADPPCPSR